MKRLRAALLFAVALVAMVATAGTASADDTTTTTVGSPVDMVALKTAKIVGIDSNWAYTGAKVTCPGSPVRSMNAYQAATFVQSWLPTGIFGHPDFANPPATTKVCRVAVTGKWGDETIRTLPVDYAFDGKTVYIRFHTTVGAADSGPAPKWFTIAEDGGVGQHVRDAFAGRAELARTAGTDIGNPTTTLPPATNGKSAAPSSSSSGSSGGVTVWIVLAVIVGGAAVAALIFRATKSKSTA